MAMAARDHTHTVPLKAIVPAEGKLEPSNVQVIGSHNWVQGKGPPTIVVPGSPAELRIPNHSLRLKKTDEIHFIDENHYRQNDHPLESCFRSVQMMSPDFNFQDSHILSDRSNLRKLLGFVAGTRTDGFRIEGPTPTPASSLPTPYHVLRPCGLFFYSQACLVLDPNPDFCDPRRPVSGHSELLWGQGPAPTARFGPTSGRPGGGVPWGQCWEHSRTNPSDSLPVMLGPRRGPASRPPESDSSSSPSSSPEPGPGAGPGSGSGSATQRPASVSHPSQCVPC